MARDKRLARGDEPQSQQQEEMTVVVLKFKGGSQSLQKGFDAVSQAIAALGPSNHRAAVQRTPAQLASSNGEVLEHEPEMEALNGDGDVGVEEAAEDNGSAPAKQKKAPVAPKYTFMSDLDLAPPGQVSLKEYCEQKQPDTENDKFLVASAWLQTQGGQETFTGSHLFTVFRAMEWKTQVDMTQPLRTLKSKKSYYENPSFGKWKLTGIGLDAAEAIGKE